MLNVMLNVIFDINYVDVKIRLTLNEEYDLNI